MNAPQMIAELEIDDVDLALTVLMAKGSERIHEPFRFWVDVAVLAGEAPLHSLIGKTATLTLVAPDGLAREVKGVVDGLDIDHETIRVELVSHLALLNDVVDYRVFVGEDTLAIVDTVLGEHGIAVERRALRTLEPRAQCVQDFESTLAFVQRLLTEEGITAFHLAGDGATLVVVDDDSGWEEPAGGPLTAMNKRGQVTDEATAVDVLYRQARVVDKASLQSYDFEKPSLNLAAATTQEEQPTEQYAYPGAYRDPKVGEVLAGLRLDQLRRRRRQVRFITQARWMAPGSVVEIDSGQDVNAGRWLVLEVAHTLAPAGDSGGTEEAATNAYTAEVVAVPADACYREPLRRGPIAASIETATITGSSTSAEIEPDAMARVTVQHRWDRRRAADDKASARTRVVQPPLSGGYMQPRVGWENLVVFAQGSSDSPWVLGRVYNGQARPPNALPGKKVVAGIGTATSPGGGSGNLVELDDAAGAEGMNFNASHNFNERTENDKNSKITANDAWTIGANRTVVIGQVLGNTVDGSQSTTISASRTLNVDSNELIDTGSETVAIGGLRTFDIGGDLGMSCTSLMRLVGGAKAETGIEHVNRSVTGTQTVLVGGNFNSKAAVSHNVSISGGSSETVAGPKKISALTYHMKLRGPLTETLAKRSTKANGDCETGYDGALDYDVGGSAKVKGATLTVKATDKITLKGGGATITITSGKISVSGDFKSSQTSADVGDEKYGD